MVDVSTENVDSLARTEMLTSERISLGISSSLFACCNQGESLGCQFPVDTFQILTEAVEHGIEYRVS